MIAKVQASNPKPRSGLAVWARFKGEHPDMLAAVKVDDFFEWYGDDAKTVADALDLTLTTRHLAGTPVPMAGVPAHALDRYMLTLKEKGHKQAVFEPDTGHPGDYFASRVLVPGKEEARMDEGGSAPPGPVKPYDPSGPTVGADAYHALGRPAGVGPNHSPKEVARAMDLTPEQLTERLKSAGHPVTGDAGDGALTDKEHAALKFEHESANGGSGYGLTGSNHEDYQTNLKSAKAKVAGGVPHPFAGQGMPGGLDPEEKDWDKVREAMHTHYKGKPWSEAQKHIQDNWPAGAARDAAARHAAEMANATEGLPASRPPSADQLAQASKEFTAAGGKPEFHDARKRLLALHDKHLEHALKGGADKYKPHTFEGHEDPHDHIGTMATLSKMAWENARAGTPEEAKRKDDLKKIAMADDKAYQQAVKEWGKRRREGITNAPAAASEVPGRKPGEKVDVANFPKIGDGRRPLHGKYSMGKVHEHLEQHYGQKGLTDKQALDFIRANGGQTYGYHPED